MHMTSLRFPLKEKHVFLLLFALSCPLECEHGGQSWSTSIKQKPHVKDPGSLMVVGPLQYQWWTTHLNFHDSQKCIALLVKPLLFWIFSHPQLNKICLIKLFLPEDLQCIPTILWLRMVEIRCQKHGFACTPGLHQFGGALCSLGDHQLHQTSQSQTVVVHQGPKLKWGHQAGSTGKTENQSYEWSGTQQSAFPSCSKAPLLTLQCWPHCNSRVPGDKCSSFQGSLGIQIFI